MSLLSLEGTDIFSYADISLDLRDRGLVLLEGENGAGKSSIFRILAWTLYGDQLRNTRADAVVRKDMNHKPITGKTSGIVRFERNGQEIRVERYRKHKEFASKLLLFVDDREITGASNNETQGRIVDLLGGIDSDTFCSAVLFPQSAKGFCSKSDAEMKAVFDRLLQLDRFFQARELAKSRSRQFQDLTTGLQATTVSLEQQLTDGQTRIEQLQSEVANFDLKKLQDIQSCKEEVAKLEAAKPAPVDPNIIAELTTLQGMITEAANVEEQYNQVTTTQTSLVRQQAGLESQIQSLQSQIPGETPAPPVAEKTIEEVADLLSVLGREEARLEIGLTSAEREVVSLDNKIAQRDSMDECGACGQELTDKAKSKLFGDLDSQRTQKMAEIESTTQKRREVTQQLEGLRDVQARALAYRSWEEMTQDRRRIQDQLVQLQDQLTKISLQLGGAEEEAVRLRDLASKGREAKDRYSSLQALKTQQEAAQELWETKLASILSQRNEAESRINPFGDLLLQETGRMGGVRDSLGWYGMLQKRTDLETGIFDWWVDGFGQQGVKTFLIERAIPFINSRLQEYLAVLSGGKATATFSATSRLADGSERDKLSVNVDYRGGDDEYAGLSGGEMARVDIAMMLALGDLASARSNINFGVRLLDEPFDGLDSIGKELVVQVLRENILPKCGTILVMTHDDSLKQLFPRIVGVDKQDGVSRIEIVG